MTDIRGRSQAEAERVYPKYPSGEAACEIDSHRHKKRKAFRAGAVWRDGLLPTRGEIAEVVDQKINLPLSSRLVLADAVLALIDRSQS